MRYVELQPSSGICRPLPFYLAMEEYLAREIPGDDCDLFFMWQVEPTVIFGRNQIIQREVNLDYCRSHSIAVYRRKSGGGCVYADNSNIMFSCITSADDNVPDTFHRYTARVAGMLRSLDIDACAGDRNDILIGDRKVSGNAFYHLHRRSIVHGTMLFDTDIAAMQAAITPSVDKLRAKGVDSVRSHVTTIVDHRPDLTIGQFKEYARHYLCGDTDPLTLTAEQVEEIECISRQYFDTSWIYGTASTSPVTTTRRIDGVGEFQITVNLDGSRISACDISGDYFLTGDLDRFIRQYVIGVDRNRKAIAASLLRADVGSVIHNLTIEQLTDLLL